ncbi:ArsA family ATPase [Rhodococcus coprophilus]|uniref:Anion-transporting ATPase n=1 Tax=Rhodococcus coprophilus TaxID=38310 RepID=A0A2X4TZV6_9NOCA|nr:ArsA family ATPase [Rhodococcus coprophilus]MBM7460468.1 arsenite-transporting ATPase [Rhodococcus coprophilus]SQI28278.1 anion-transporting ATPase [Rhodococcus coprophilus]
MRVFFGKGGAGKTTLAAATAVGLARTGEAVLIASIDQAHSLSGVLGVATGPGVRAAADGLDLIEIDSLALLEQRYASVASLASLAAGHEHGDRFALPAPEELTGLPGIEGLLALSEVARLAGSGRWSTVIVDAPASADAVRMLAAPRTISEYMDRIWPQHSRVEAAVGPDPRLAVVVALFDRVLKGIEATRDLLEDPARTTAVLVSTPDRVGLTELIRLRSWTALTGLTLEAVVANGIVPAFDDDGPAGQWLARRRGDQSAVLDEMTAIVTEVPVVACEQRDEEPVGWASLGELATGLLRDLRDPHALPGGGVERVRVQHESGTGVDAVYAMRMHLPLADPTSLTLGRVDDDLVVGADGIRRRMRLASVLRRCTVSEAEFDGTDLVVRFVPDPAVWPQ